MGNEITRKDFLKLGVAGTVAVAGMLSGKNAPAAQPEGREFKEKQLTEIDPKSKVINSCCLGCDSRCGVRIQTLDGQIHRIQGNPYSPQNMGYDPIHYATPAVESLKVSGQTCLKGASGAHYNYDPLRIVAPLKRNGPRGSDKWKVIPWEQLIREVVEGGKIFADIGEERQVEGLRAVRSENPIDPKQPELGPKSNQVSMIYGGGGGQPPRPQM
jgi:tetrathionate reductase subunit A